MRLLIASDLSNRAERAFQRAALLYQQQKASLTVLHVVDESLPLTLQKSHRKEAQTLLQQQLAAMKNATAEIAIKVGNPFQAIVQEAKLRQADMLILGAHRRRILKDVFTGTTIERVIRSSPCPVLMVNTEPTGPYQKLLVALDLSDLAITVLRQSKALGLFQKIDLMLVHAFTPLAKGSMHYAGVESQELSKNMSLRRRKRLSRSSILFFARRNLGN